MPPIPPGADYTHVITLTSPLAETQERIQFSEEEIRETIEGFYVRVDSLADNPYGLVPEYDEWNNVGAIDLRPWEIYLPLVAKGGTSAP
jgi:hypothetical protein